MNKRFIVIGIFLGAMITVSFFIGCPNQEINSITGGYLCQSFDIGR